jgi:molybdopterin-guanine dinucleotide biosynthesis protein
MNYRWGFVLLNSSDRTAETDVTRETEEENIRRQIRRQLESMTDDLFFCGDLDKQKKMNSTVEKQGVHPFAWLNGVLAVSDAMPLFRPALGRLLREAWKPGLDAVFWQGRSGELFTDCIFSSAQCWLSLRSLLRQEQQGLRQWVEEHQCRILRTDRWAVPDSWFFAAASPAAAAAFRSMKPAVLAVSGLKKTGKTMLIEKLLHGLKDAGWRCAVVKHDGHDFEADVPGTDSYRFKKAGALGTVVYSDRKFCMVKDGNYRADDFFPFFQSADLILLEGQKHSSYPKIEVLYTPEPRAAVCNPASVIAYASAGEFSEKTLNGRPIFHISAYQEILEFIAQFYDGQSGLAPCALRAEQNH